jgi:cytokinin dehydrogenase
MSGKFISRRQLLTGIGAGALVVGYDLNTRSWVSAAHAAACPSFADVPSLDGKLIMDDSAIEENSRDAGNMVRNAPCAVLYPANVHDVQKMVRYCGEHQIHVAANTGRNSVYGQTLVKGGLIVNGKSLNTIHSITPEGADVDGGVLWYDLITAAFDNGLTPASITGYTKLGVAGTLSIGGLNGISSNRRVPQTAHVQHLEVVTGDGSIVQCSPTENTALFKAMCAGQGQCGIITRARIDMIRAPRMARLYRSLPYTSISTCMSDLRRLATRGEAVGGFDWVASVNNPGTGPLLPVNLWAVAFFDPGSPPPPTSTLMDGCSLTARTAPYVDLDYLTYVRLVDVLVDTWRVAPGWDRLVKPWFNVVLPDNAADKFVESVIPKLGLEDVSATTFVVLCPVLASSFSDEFPLFRAPSTSTGTWSWIFGILTNSATPLTTPGFASRMLDRNYEWWTKAVALGGARYVEDAQPFAHADWRTHYGSALYTKFAAWKKRFDPHGILGPGPGIF